MTAKGGEGDHNDNDDRSGPELPIPNTYLTWTIGNLCRVFLNQLSRTRIEGLPELLSVLPRALSERRGKENKPPPLLTYSNHISTLDDPLMWGMLPGSLLSQTSRLRWSLGASEILFTRSLYRGFFGAGKVLPITRGSGLSQLGMDLASKALARGDWVHVFPEGRVSPAPNTIAGPLKWGLTHLILNYYETHGQVPVILPIILKGFDQVMPPYSYRWCYMPRVFKELHISVGERLPIDVDYIASLLSKYQLMMMSSSSSSPSLHQQQQVPGQQMIFSSPKRHAHWTPLRRDLCKTLGHYLVILHNRVYALNHLI